MTNIIPVVTSQDSSQITFTINNLTLASGVYVFYDTTQIPLSTSTGQSNHYRGNYYVWRVKSSTGGVTINNNNAMNQSLAIDYTSLDTMYFEFFTFFEYVVFDMFSLKVDMVSRRYPQTFEKKFSLRELANCMEASVADINLYPPLTHYWFKFTRYDDETNVAKNPYCLQSGVPWEWTNIAATGAMLNALVAQGLLEVDINFGYSDQGVSITYNNMDPVKGWFTTLTEQFGKDRDSMKKNYWHPMASATIPYSFGIPGVLQTLMGPLSTVGMPWWQNFGIGRSA